MAVTKKRAIGDLGEKVAVKFLKKNKYKIIETNYSNKYGEIDIICSIKDYLVFVEVKTRSKDSFTTGYEAVNKKKQYNIFKTAHTYMNEYPTDKQPRFDIIEVEYDKLTQKASVREHYDNAFIQGGDYGVF